MEEFAKQEFNKIKQEAEAAYKLIGQVYSPYLKKNISFNAKGLEHIKFNGRSKARLVSEQFTRLRFLKLVPTVIKDSHTLQEYKKTRCFEPVKSSGKWSKVAIDVEYFAFIAIINSVRIKVIIKWLAGGQPFFWSVIPFWKTDHELLGQIKKVFFEGDPEDQ